MTRRLERTKTCCYPLCRRSSKQNDPSVSFFYFPKSSELRSQWTKRMKVPHFKPGRRTFVCSDHFSVDCFSLYPFADQSRGAGLDGKPAEHRRRLIRGSVPTLFKRTEAGWVEGSEDDLKVYPKSSPCSTWPLDQCPLSFHPESAALEFSVCESPHDASFDDPREDCRCNGECAAQTQTQREDPRCGQKRPHEQTAGDSPLPAEPSGDALIRKRCRIGEQREATPRAFQTEDEKFPQQASLPREMQSTADLRFQGEVEFDQHHALLEYRPFAASFEYCSEETDNVPLDLSSPSVAVSAQQDGATPHSHAKSPSYYPAYKHLSELLTPALTVGDERALGSPAPVLIPQYGCPCFPDFVRCVSTQEKDNPTKERIKQEASDDGHKGHRVSRSNALISPVQSDRTQPTGPVESISTGDEDIAFGKIRASIKRETHLSASESGATLPASSPAQILNNPERSHARVSSNPESSLEEISNSSASSPTEIMKNPASSSAEDSSGPAFRRAEVIKNIASSPPEICNGPAYSPPEVCNGVAFSPAQILNFSASSNASVPSSTVSSPEKNVSHNEAAAKKEHRRRTRQHADVLSAPASSLPSSKSERDHAASVSKKTKPISARSLTSPAVSFSSQTPEAKGSCSVEKNQTHLASTDSCPKVPLNGTDPQDSLSSPVARPSLEGANYVGCSGETEGKRSERSHLSGLPKFDREPDFHSCQPVSVEKDELVVLDGEAINMKSYHAENRIQTSADSILLDRFPQTVAKSCSKKSREKLCGKNASHVAGDYNDRSCHPKPSTLSGARKMPKKNSSEMRKANLVPPAPILVSPFPLPSLPSKNQTISVLITEGAETRVPVSQVRVKPRKKNTKPSLQKVDHTETKDFTTHFTKQKHDRGSLDTSMSSMPKTSSNPSSPFPYGAVIITNEGVKPVLQLRLDNSHRKPVIKQLSDNPGGAVRNASSQTTSYSTKQRKSESCSVSAASPLKSSAVGPSVPSNKTRSSAEQSPPHPPPQVVLTTVPQLEFTMLPSAKEHPQMSSCDTAAISCSSDPQSTSTSTVSSLSLGATERNKVSSTPVRVPVTCSRGRNSTEVKSKPPEINQIWHQDNLLDLEEKTFQSKGLLANVLIRQEHLVHDVFCVYKDNIDKIASINFILVDTSGAANPANPGDSKLGARISLKALLSKFWKRCAECFFEGDEQKVPKTEMSGAAAVPDDVPFQLGKILRHGLMACGYWPVMLSIPCAVYVLTGKRCSESLLHDCLRKVMFEFEVMALDDLQDAAAHDSAQGDGRGHRGVHPFDLIKTEDRVSLVLRLYGGEHCKVPERHEISRFLREVASYYLHFRPYWWLREMRRGFLSLEDKDHALLVVEAKVLELYHKLEPTPQAVLKRTVFSLGSGSKEEQDKEKRCKSFLERSLFRFGREDLSRLLMEWSDADCVLDDKYYVTFTSTAAPAAISKVKDGSGVAFHPEKCTLVLSASWPSFDVFYSTLILRIRGAPDVGTLV